RGGHVQRVGARQQLDRERADRLAVPGGVEAVAAGAEADLRQVAQLDRGAVGVRAQDDVGELFGAGEAAFGGHRGGEALAGHGRVGAQRAGGKLHVLRGDRGEHLRSRQVVALQLVRVQPDAHRVFGTELLGAAHAGYARDLVQHLRADDVVEAVAVDVRVVRLE